MSRLNILPGNHVRLYGMRFTSFYVRRQHTRGLQPPLPFTTVIVPGGNYNVHLIYCSPISWDWV